MLMVSRAMTGADIAARLPASSTVLMAVPDLITLRLQMVTLTFSRICLTDERTITTLCDDFVTAPQPTTPGHAFLAGT